MHGGTTIAVTASFGVASFPQNGKNGVELLAVADAALYAAKRGGRNQVSCVPEAEPATTVRVRDEALPANGRSVGWNAA